MTEGGGDGTGGEVTEGGGDGTGRAGEQVKILSILVLIC